MSTQAKIAPKIAWVTGASSGIGRALCLRLAHDGWIIAATARNAESLMHLQDEAPKGSVHCYPGDVANPARMKDIIGQVMTHLGGLDMVVMGAGILTPDTAANFSSERFRRMMETNLGGTANVLAPALEHFRQAGQGHVVFVSSLAAYMGMSGFLSYGATKAAVYNMAQSLAADLAGTNIKVQVITPGYVATPLIQHIDTGTQRPLDVATAADQIMRGLKSSRFEISFPRTTSLSLRLISYLPERIAQFVLTRARHLQE